MASLLGILNLPVKFHPPTVRKPFSFLKRKFGTKDEQSFKVEFCEDTKYYITILVVIQPSVTFV